jgi:hypothetical protein
VQLKTIFAAMFAAGALALAADARAQVVDFNTTHSVFYEAPTRTHMFVYTPGVDLQATPWSFLDVRAGWEADVVSGASIATKAGAAFQANHPSADVISAASVHDFRNVGHGGFTLRNGNTSLTGGYAYSTEHDYRSNSFNVSARTDAYEHNTQFELAYSHNFDKVCDRVQPVEAVSAAPRLLPLEDSSGCFASSNALRTTRDVDISDFQGSWTQSWTPILATQLVYTAELQHGFLQNPYRAVVLGEGLKAQEHHPENRARESLTARVNLFIKPIKSALHLGVRAYWDTWDIKSGTAEADLERRFFESLRLSVRGRFYKQTGALFWSDDYTGGEPPLGPKGQYWTGDRELSPFSSFSGGLRAIWEVNPQKRILGIMSGIKLSAAGDVVVYHYDEYTLGGQSIFDARAYIGTLSFTALF